MTYLIDGHNLIGRLPDIRLDEPHDEALLVQKLLAFAARTKQRCVVIFDQGLPGGKSRMSTRAVEVIFAPHRSNADQVMMRRIKAATNPQEWTIVSSDNDVLNAAQHRKMKTLKSFEFAELLKPPAQVKPGVDESPDVRLSPAEVEEWLHLFNSRKG